MEHNIVEDVNHPHRKFLLGIIEKYNPKSILDVGCGYGGNIGNLVKMFPNAEVIGFDIDNECIKFARKAFGDYPNVSLFCDRIQNIKDVFKSTSFDIILTDAVLMMIPPEEIHGIIEDMLHVGNNLIMCEWNIFNKWTTLALGFYYRVSGKCKDLPFIQNSKLGVCVRHSNVYSEKRWARDYKALLSDFGVKDIMITKLPEKFGDKRWDTLGSVIEART